MDSLIQLVAVSEGWLAFTSWMLIGSVAKDMSLVIGVATFIGGVSAMVSHQRTIEGLLAAKETANERMFQRHKYRRRVVCAGLIASLGVMIAAIYWVQEPRAFASLISMILLLLLAILGIALFDMYSIGIEALSRTDQPDRKEIIEQYLEQKRRAHLQSTESNAEDAET